MADRHITGILDTCTYVDLYQIDGTQLPALPKITTLTIAELQQGVAMARDAATRAIRAETLNSAIAEFEPIPFDQQAAARYGTLVSLTIAAGRDPRPRRIDLMIGSIASTRCLPLFTRNIDDFRGLGAVLTVVGV
ncbi:MAG TPA: type II toxin-antitoxin system VapC family toxin [Mycobacteriales bacterium]|nr:type II toxin-antitoxin system VapC family toxin [Mycobacteriales bacterium]